MTFAAPPPAAILGDRFVLAFHPSWHSTMPSYDLLMLFVLLGTTLFGFWKGMAWQVASLASFALSYVAALRFSSELAPVFGDHAPWNRFVAMLVIYIVTSFAIWMLFRLVSGAIDKVKLEAFDRQLGAMFGLAKGILLCVAITFFAVMLLPPAQGEAIVASRSGHYIIALLNKTDAVVPPEIHQVIDPYLEKVQQRLNPEHQADWPMPASQVAPQSLPRMPWTQDDGPRPAGPLPVWPTETQSAGEDDPYRVPHEPRPFPNPYSADLPTGGTF
jgi:membrane protein required for colicin V production